MTIQSSKKEPHQNIVRTYLPLGLIRIPYDGAGKKLYDRFDSRTGSRTLHTSNDFPIRRVCVY